MAKSWNQGADKFSRAAKKNIKVKRSRNDWEADEDDDFRPQRNVERDTEATDAFDASAQR